MSGLSILRRCGGQAAVELVVLLPLILIGAATCLQLMLAAHAGWSASAAARAAARAHAVGGEELRAARRALPDSLERHLEVEDSDSGGVVVRVRIPTVVPGLPLGALTARARFAEQR